MVKSEVCLACGVGIRQKALFCHNCGKSTRSSSGRVLNENKRRIIKVKLRRRLRKLRKENDPSKESSGSESELNDYESTLINEESKADCSKKPAGVFKNEKSGKSGMRADIFTNSPEYGRENKIEIVWEENSESPNIFFLLMASLIIFFVAGLFFLAMYFR